MHLKHWNSESRCIHSNPFYYKRRSCISYHSHHWSLKNPVMAMIWLMDHTGVDPWNCLPLTVTCIFRGNFKFWWKNNKWKQNKRKTKAQVTENSWNRPSENWFLCCFMTHLSKTQQNKTPLKPLNVQCLLRCIALHLHLWNKMYFEGGRVDFGRWDGSLCCASQVQWQHTTDVCHMFPTF